MDEIKRRIAMEEISREEAIEKIKQTPVYRYECELE